MSQRPLNARMRAFADAWNGRGTGTAACRTAGYQGGDRTLEALAPKLLRDPRIRARIAERLGQAALDAYDAGPPEAPAPATAKPPDGLVAGKGRGTATERVSIAMGLARSRKVDPKDRIAALRLAAELEQELRPGRQRRDRGPGLAPAPPASPAPVSRATSSAPAPGLRLIVNERDRAEGVDG